MEQIIPSYKPVTALLRGLDVLTVINRLNGRVTVGEIHHHTGIDKATIVRMLETLSHAGFVVRHHNGPYYEVSGKTLLLSSGYDRHRIVGSIVSPIMKRFRDEISWPSDIAIFDGNQMLIVETSRQAGPLLVSRHPGYRAPLLGTSLGMAYLSCLNETERNIILQRESLDTQPWNNLARDKKLAEQALDEIKQRGYALMHPEYSIQEYANKIGSIGIPISSPTNVLAAINVLFLKNVLPVERAIEQLLLPLQNVADEIAIELAKHDNS